ncbi:hypothetical protein LY76DRAFT_290407 [Colletotrichum caudatum]|nr:hypothetical protein LY76DRAFT_290407 [Colletotrichum caudatum]
MRLRNEVKPSCVRVQDGRGTHRHTTSVLIVEPRWVLSVRLSLMVIRDSPGTRCALFHFPFALLGVARMFSNPVDALGSRRSEAFLSALGRVLHSNYSEVNPSIHSLLLCLERISERSRGDAAKPRNGMRIALRVRALTWVLGLSGNGVRCCSSM